MKVIIEGRRERREGRRERMEGRWERMKGSRESMEGRRERIEGRWERMEGRRERKRMVGTRKGTFNREGMEREIYYRWEEGRVGRKGRKNWDNAVEQEGGGVCKNAL